MAEDQLAAANDPLTDQIMQSLSSNPRAASAFATRTPGSGDAEEENEIIKAAKKDIADTKKKAMENPIVAAQAAPDAAAEYLRSFTMGGGAGGTITIDPSDAIKGVEEFSAKTDIAMEALENNTEAQNTLAGQIASTDIRMKQSENSTAQHKLMTDMKAQSETLEALNPERTYQMLTDINEKFLSAVEARNAKAAEVDAIINTSIAEDGFFNWLAAEFKAPFVVDELRAADHKVSRLAESVDQIRELGADTKTSVGQLQKVIADDAVEQLTNKQQAELDKIKLDTDLANLKNNSAQVAASLEMLSSELDFRVRTMSAVTQNQAIRLQTYNALKEQQQWLEMTKIINNGRSQVEGLVALTEAQVKAAVATGNQSVIDQFNIGFSLLGKSQGDTPIGQDFGDAVRIVQTLSPEGLREDSIVGRLANDVQSLAATNALTETGKLLEELDQDSVTALYEEAKQTIIKQYGKNITDSNNIFAIPEFETISKQRAVKNTTLYDKVLKDKPIDDAPNRDTAIIQAAFEEATSGEKGAMSMQEAANDLATIFTAGTVLNADLNSFRQFHIPIPEHYNLMLDLSGSTRFRKPGALMSDLMQVNMRDPSSILEYFAKKRANFPRNTVIPGPDTTVAP